MALPGFTWLYLALLGCTKLYLAVPGCTRLYMAVLGYTRSGLVSIEGFRAILNTQTYMSMDGWMDGWMDWMGYLQTGPFLDHLAVKIRS